MTRPNTLTPNSARLAAIASSLGLRSVVLFGSQASGMQLGPDSDLDLAVRLKPAGSPLTVWDLHEALQPVFTDHTLDIVILNQADTLLRWEVMRAGVLLWGDEDDFHEYRLYAYRDFVDSADLRALEQTLFEKKMTVIARKLDAAS